MTSVDYATKHSGYFGIARTEVFGLLPERMDRVLELGCGTGATLAALRATGRCKRTAGIELFESAAMEVEKPGTVAKRALAALADVRRARQAS